MPRMPRLFLPGGIYHVYCRVARGEPIFEDADEAQRWIETVAVLAKAHELRVFAWCLMSNHYHLVIKTGGKVLWRAMARIQGAVARSFNRRHRYDGRLWQSRYKARLVLDNDYLAHLFAYVHLNPVAAGVVMDPAEHLWNGHGELMGLRSSRLADVREALLCFDDDVSQARRIYQDRLRIVAEIRMHELTLSSLPWWRRVREDEQTISENDAPAASVTFCGQPHAPEVDVRPPLSRVLTVAEECLGLPIGRLTGCTRTRSDSWHRCLFSTLAVSWLGFTNIEVTRCLKKGRSSVSRWLDEGHRLQQSSSEFREALENLRAAIDLESGNHD